MTGSAGTLVPYGESDQPPGGSGSPLRRLREQMRAYPLRGGGDARGRAILYGALGSVAALVGAVAAAALPSGDGVRGAGFFAIGRDMTAGVVDAFGGLAAPLAVIGAILLLGTAIVYLLETEHEWADLLLTVQPVVGLGALGLSAAGWSLLLVLVAINLVFWIVLGCLILAGLVLVLGGLVGAIGDG